MRMMTDCREFPSESGCSLVIAGDKDEVLAAATQHAVTVHQHQMSDELKKEIERTLRPTSAFSDKL